MRKPSTEVPEELGSYYLENHQLDTALTAMQQLYSERQMVEGSDFSTHQQVLWSKILVAKSRFSGNPFFASMALKKLEVITEALPMSTAHPILFSLEYLKFEANLLLNNWSIGKKLALQLQGTAQKEDNPINLIKTYHLLVEIAIQEEDLDKALDLIRSAQKLILLQPKPTKKVLKIKNHLLLSKIFYEEREYEQALFYCRKILAATQNDFALEEYLIRALLLSSKCARQQREFDTAIQLLLEAERRSRQIQHEQLSNESKLNRGILYNAVSDYPRTIQLFSEFQADNKFYLNNRVINLLFHLEWGKACYYMKDYTKAKQLFNRILQHSDGSKHLKEMAIGLAYLSCIHTQLEELQQALRFAKKCNQMLTKLSGDVEGSQINLINLGVIHYRLGKYSEAIKLTSRGIATAKRLQDELSEIKGFQLMAKIFQQQKDFKNAFLYQTIYTKFYEDFYEKNDRQVVRDLEYEYALNALSNKAGKNQM